MSADPAKVYMGRGVNAWRSWRLDGLNPDTGELNMVQGGMRKHLSKAVSDRTMWRIRSLTTHGGLIESATDFEAEAKCNRRHMAPTLVCMCGWYSHAILLDNYYYTPDTQVFTNVDLYGRIVEHEKGYRSQFMKLNFMVLIKERFNFTSARKLNRIAESLSEHYMVECRAMSLRELVGSREYLDRFPNMVIPAATQGCVEIPSSEVPQELISKYSPRLYSVEFEGFLTRLVGQPSAVEIFKLMAMLSDEQCAAIEHCVRYFGPTLASSPKHQDLIDTLNSVVQKNFLLLPEYIQNDELFFARLQLVKPTVRPNYVWTNRRPHMVARKKESDNG